MLKRFHFAALTIASVLGLAAAGGAYAHHSFAMFDMEKDMKLDGTVRTFQWTNPHTWLWLYVKDAKGGQTLWGLEGTAPGELSRKGWTRDSVKPGDKLRVDVPPLKDGRPGGRFTGVILAGGRKLGDVNIMPTAKWA